MQTIVHKIDQTFDKELLKKIIKLQKQQDYQSIWQDISWNQMIQKTGYTEAGFFIGIQEDTDLLCYGILEKRNIGLGQFGLFLIGGPVVDSEFGVQSSKKIINSDSYQSDSVMAEEEPLTSARMTLASSAGGCSPFSYFFSECEKLCRHEGCLFVQIEPLSEFKHKPMGWKNSAFKKFIEPYTTTIDLTQEEDKILASMKPKGRYNIKVAEKSEVTIQWKKCTPDTIEIFHNLLTETTKRDKFSTNGIKYFVTLGEYVEENNFGGLLFAEKNGEILAAGLFIYYGNSALYYYGASVSAAEKRKYMASYLLQWEAIREGKKRKCTSYDFLGIAPPGDDTHHLTGVTDFKLKLSPDIHKWPEAIIYAPKNWKYQLFLLARKLKNLRK